MATLLEKCNLILNNKNTNLKPENLKEGVTCLGVTGQLEEGIDTSDATAGPYDMAQGTSAYVNGEKVEGALPVYEAGDTVNSDTVQYLAPEVKVRISEDCILHENSAVVIDEVILANSAQIDSSMIMSGNQVLGVYGTATEDADATDEDLLEMKTAYSRGQRIYGTIGNWRGTQIPVSTDSVRVEEDEIHVYIHPEVQATGYNVLAIDNDCGMGVTVPNNEVAESIGLTSDMIVEGNRVLGIDGTAILGEGGSATEGVKLFSSVEEMEADNSGADGDLAIVYTELEKSRMKPQQYFQKAMFPQHVSVDISTVPESFTDFKITDTGDETIVSTTECIFSPSELRLSISTPNGTVNVQYSGNGNGDYDRVDLSGEGADGDFVDFGEMVYCHMDNDYCEAMFEFVYAYRPTFSGLYERSADKYEFIRFENLPFVGKQTSSGSNVAIHPRGGTDHLSVYDTTSLLDMLDSIYLQYSEISSLYEQYVTSDNAELYQLMEALYVLHESIPPTQDYNKEINDTVYFIEGRIYNIHGGWVGSSDGTYSDQGVHLGCPGNGFYFQFRRDADSGNFYICLVERYY